MCRFCVNVDNTKNVKSITNRPHVVFIYEIQAIFICNLFDLFNIFFLSVRLLRVSRSSLRVKITNHRRYHLYGRFIIYLSLSSPASSDLFHFFFAVARINHYGYGFSYAESQKFPFFLLDFCFLFTSLGGAFQCLFLCDFL